MTDDSDDRAAQARADMVHFTPSAQDVRIVRGDWIYHVRVIRRGESFLDDQLWSLVPVAVDGFLRVLGRRLGWKVGIVRSASPSSWRVDRHRVVTKQVLPTGARPEPYLDRLAEAIRRGEFDGR